ncbi:MAG: outer membrane beta-barrel protein, partial [Chthoniobacteraceae bacterium]
SGLFQGGFSALYGRDRLATLWFSYDLAGNYPENPAQGRQSGVEGGSGGFDHNLSLIGSFTFPELRKVRFVFGAKYARLSGIDRDTGENSKRQIATALFITNYQYSKKTSFSVDVSLPVRQFSDGISSNGVTSTLFANTDITQKTSVGLGYTFGSLDVQDGDDQIFHQALMRVNYSPTRFLLFDATAGVDFRGRGDSSSATPIFGLSTTWDSRHGTLVTLAAERRIFNAASASNTNFTSMTVVLSAYHRFGRSMIGSISAGYEYSEYDSTGSGAQSSRTDKLSYVSAGVTVPLALRWNCTLSGSAGRNESDVAGFDFVQMTFKTSLTF